MIFLYRIWGLRKISLVIENFFFNLYYKNTLGNRIMIFGWPIIFVPKKENIKIGKNVILISTPYFSEPGISHPVIIRLLNAKAKLTIGDRVGMSGGCICVKLEVSIGDDVMLGANVSITDTDFHALDPANRRDAGEYVLTRKVVIGNNVFIGMNTIILKGVTVGDNSVIGAGSVVARDVPANQVWAGNPAKFIRNL